MAYDRQCLKPESLSEQKLPCGLWGGWLSDDSNITIGHILTKRVATYLGGCAADAHAEGVGDVIAEHAVQLLLLAHSLLPPRPHQQLVLPQQQLAVIPTSHKTIDEKGQKQR